MANVFLSYARKDRSWLIRLRKHLDVLQRNGTVTFWDDSAIAVGTSWQADINRVLDASDAALLLISGNFLDSKFIREDELPRMLLRSDAGELKVINIYIDHSNVELADIPYTGLDGAPTKKRLTSLQGFISPKQPLSSLRGSPNKEKAFVEFSRKLLASLGIDESTPPAQTLGLDDGPSITKAAIWGDAPQVAPQTVEVHLSIPFSEWTADAEAAFTQRMCMALELSPDQFIIMARKAGSTILTVQMPERAIDEFVQLAEIGVFAAIGITTVRRIRLPQMELPAVPHLPESRAPDRAQRHHRSSGIRTAKQAFLTPVVAYVLAALLGVGLALGWRPNLGTDFVVLVGILAVVLPPTMMRERHSG